MTVDDTNIELAAKRGNPSVIWRSGQERPEALDRCLATIHEFVAYV